MLLSYYFLSFYYLFFPGHFITPRRPSHYIFFFVAFPLDCQMYALCPDLSVREECDEEPSQSDETEAEMSPPKSPSTPKNVKSKNSGTV